MRMQDDWTVGTYLASDGLSIGVQDSAHCAIRVALHDRAIRQVYLQQAIMLTSRLIVIVYWIGPEG